MLVKKIICLVNNWDVELDDEGEYSLVNGLIGNVTKVKNVDEKANIGQLNFKPDFLDEECKGFNL